MAAVETVTDADLKAHDCLEDVDRVPRDPETTAFKRRARLHQSALARKQGFEIGSQPMRPKPGQSSRPLGSRIAVDAARESQANFLNEDIRRAVRDRLANPSRTRPLDEDRTLLRSPVLDAMCFNLSVFCRRTWRLLIGRCTLGGRMWPGRVCAVSSSGRQAGGCRACTWRTGAPSTSHSRSNWETVAAESSESRRSIMRTANERRLRATTDASATRQSPLGPESSRWSRWRPSSAPICSRYGLTIFSHCRCPSPHRGNGSGPVRTRSSSEGTQVDARCDLTIPSLLRDAASIRVSTIESLLGRCGSSRMRLLYCRQGHMLRFALTTLGGHDEPLRAADFMFQGQSVSDLEDLSVISLSPPRTSRRSTRTRAHARSSARSGDAQLALTLYRRAGVLWREGGPGRQPVGAALHGHVAHGQRLRPVSYAARLAPAAWELVGNRFVKDGQVMLPLYEAKMAYLYTHRSGTYEAASPGERPHRFADALTSNSRTRGMRLCPSTGFHPLTLSSS